MKALVPLLWPVLACLLGVAAVLLAVAWLQDRLLYFPARASVAQMGSGGLRAWPSVQDFRGLVAEPAGAVRATVVVFHGNAGHAGHRGFYAEALVPLGFRVILAEYPGYGPRPGDVGERSLVDDAVLTLQRARQQYAEAPLLLIGESLGAGVAAAAVGREHRLVAGLLLITPWDRLVHVASFHYPWLPVTWLLRDRYDSAAHLAGFDRPVLVAVAEHDAVVPARSGHALFDAARQPKRLQLLRGAGHNDWVLQADAAWWREAMAFLLGPKPAPPS